MSIDNKIEEVSEVQPITSRETNKAHWNTGNWAVFEPNSVKRTKIISSMNFKMVENNQDYIHIDDFNTNNK